MAKGLETAARPRRAGAWLSIAALLLAAVVGGILWMRTDSAKVPEADSLPSGSFTYPWPPQSVVQIIRDGRRKNLEDVLPLKANEQVRIEANVPSEMGVTIFWFTPSGRLTEHGVGERIQAGLESYVKYPSSESGKILALEGPGTYFLFLCGDDTAGPRVSDLPEIPVLDDEKPWPSLPPDMALVMNGRGRAVAVGDDRGLETAPASEIVYDNVEQVRQLLNKHFDFVAGVAFTAVAER
jgi:hypothetical protein